MALPLVLFITAVGNFWGIGGESAIFRALEKDDLQEAKLAAAFSFYGAVIMTAVFCAIAFCMGNTFEYMLVSSETDLDFADRYIFWMFVT